MTEQQRLDSIRFPVEWARIQEAIDEVRRGMGTMAFEIVQEPETAPVRGRDGVDHAAGHGYDGGGQHSWDCICGAGGNGFGSDDRAAVAMAEHLAEVEIHTEDPDHPEGV